MRRTLRFLGLAGSIAFVVVACGARSGLDVDLPPEGGTDSSIDRDSADVRDGTSDRDATPDSPPFIEGGPLDVVTDCPDTDGLTEDATVVVVLAWLTVCVNVEEVLVMK